MAFKSIGTLACAVLREAELRAARQSTAANGSGKPSGVAQLPDAPTTGGIGMGGGTPVREDADVPPRRSNPRGQVRATENGKGRGTVKATASVRGGAEQLRGGTAIAPETAYGQRMKPALRLVMGGRGRAIATANTKGRPQPSAVAGPLLLVVGGTQ